MQVWLSRQIYDSSLTTIYDSSLTTIRRDMVLLSLDLWHCSMKRDVEEEGCRSKALTPSWQCSSMTVWQVLWLAFCATATAL